LLLEFHLVSQLVQVLPLFGLFLLLVALETQPKLKWLSTRRKLQQSTKKYSKNKMMAKEK
jgi:cystathionine beta-lyase family protein involved in aluminum resistance